MKINLGLFQRNLSMVMSLFWPVKIIKIKRIITWTSQGKTCYGVNMYLFLVAYFIYIQATSFYQFWYIHTYIHNLYLNTKIFKAIKACGIVSLRIKLIYIKTYLQITGNMLYGHSDSYIFCFFVSYSDADVHWNLKSINLSSAPTRLLSCVKFRVADASFPL